MRVIKWLFKHCLMGIVWVFILSLEWHDEPIYSPLSDLLVRNSFIRDIDENLADFFEKFEKAIHIAWHEPTRNVAKKIQ
jgi:hypothetical protein